MPAGERRQRRRQQQQQQKKEEEEEEESDASSKSAGSEDEDDDEVEIGDSINLRIGAAGVSALDFHPSDRRLACGTVDGRVRVYDTEGSLEQPVLRGRFHKCARCVRFHGDDGCLLISGSSLGAFKLHDARTAQLVAKNNKAHDCGINCLLSVNPNQFVCGDEDGFVRLFDLRKSQAAVFSCHVQADWRPEPQAAAEDAESEAQPAAAAAGGDGDSDAGGLCGVAQLCQLPGHLLAACEDGTLTTVSLHKRKILMKSEFYGHPLTSVCGMKKGSKVVAGTEEGCLLLFNSRQLGNLSDRSSVARGASVEAACKVSEDLLVCACSDSRLYAVSVLPNRTLRCLGRQPSDAGRCLSVACDCEQSLLASASPDSAQIRLWAVGHLQRLQLRERRSHGRGRRRRREAAGDGDGDSDGDGDGERPTAKAGRRFSADAQQRAEFLSGLTAAGSDKT